MAMYRMHRTFFMNLPPPPVVTETPVLTRIRATMLAISLAVTGCVSQENTDPQYHIIQKSEMSECNTESKEYYILVWTTAQIQAWIEFITEMRSTWTIKTFIEEEMKKENVTGEVTVKTCPPTKNEEWTFTYIIIRVSGVGSTKIYSRNPAIAHEMSSQIHTNDTL